MIGISCGNPTVRHEFVVELAISILTAFTSAILSGKMVWTLPSSVSFAKIDKYIECWKVAQVG